MKRTGKIKYEVDPQNRLVVIQPGEDLRLPGYRTVLDGRFGIDGKNDLTYHTKTPQGSDVPRQVRLSGKWSLDKGHDLVLTLDGENKQYAGDKLTIKGGIIDAKDSELVFSVTVKDGPLRMRAYLLKFGGVWRADKYNRLAFDVARERGAADTLTMTGRWYIGANNRIVYIYEKARLKTKERTANTVTLKGYWDITEKCRILYVLNKKINSQFDLKVSLGKPLKRGLRYEIGIGIVPAKRTITLSGEWKVNEKLGVLFEMPYERGKLRSVVFGASCRPGKGNELSFKLKNEFGRDLGMDVKLSRKCLKGAGELFLRALASGGEKQVLIGAGWLW
ncbi:MAG: hypothetical protein ABIA77_07215 [Candidatus Omnitrophota bacterium]